MATEKCGNTSVLQRERERDRRKRWNETKGARKEGREELRKGRLKGGGVEEQTLKASFSP